MIKCTLKDCNGVEVEIKINATTEELIIILEKIKLT